jgi:uncharacterized sulfatase
MSQSLSRRGLVKKVIYGGLAVGALAAVGAEIKQLLSRRSMDELYGPYPGPEAYKPVKLADAKAQKPNVIIIYCDDLGYGDLGCYGSKVIRTPNIDRLATQGLRCTDYYACNAVCSPSRAGLLTGRYPFRSGMTGNPYPADEAKAQLMARNLGKQLSPLGGLDLHEDYAIAGISDKELMLPKALKLAGYRTAMIGKWHLGDFSRQPEFNPVRYGFDRFYGVPHSNDMRPFPLYRNDKEEMTDAVPALGRLTSLYTAEALDVIESARGEPFFLYLAHTFPHQPLAASEKFAGKSRGGKYGDAVEEIDWSVGEIVAALERAGVSDKTLLIFTSDNGPWFEGSAGELRGGKGQAYDGAFKVPFIAKWPNQIKAGSQSSELISNMDLFPTLLHLAGVEQPADRVIDGKNILGVLTGTVPKSPRESMFFYHYDQLQAVRAGQWKYIRETNRYVWPIPLDAEAVPRAMGKVQLGPDRSPLLYDLSADPGERYNVIHAHRDVANKLDALMVEWELQVKKNPRGFLVPAA